ncbi:MAG: hypothetical protein KME09_07140 [Pleurocapsa minor HA4230-MV1]|jgi:hypothetical protein|nr:hypothetical protein [Pleurocapsa minor HA4230-MV1]
MNYTSFINIFDFFVSCYVYGCLTYILLLFSVQLYHSLLIDCEALDRSIESVDTDFYSQVKDLLDPSTEDVFEPIFESMTLRELRTHIKENKLHQKIQDRLGKTVSNACKHELIEALS